MNKFTDAQENKISISDPDRTRRIIDFIINHQGCNKESLVKGIKNYVSRKTVYKRLEDLGKDNIVRIEKDKPNSRDHKLFVDYENPFVLIPLELEDFEEKFFTYVNIYLKKIKELKKTQLEKYEYIIDKLKNFPIRLLNCVFQLYILRINELQLQINNADVNKFFSILFGKLTQIYSKFTTLATDQNNIQYLHTYRRDYKRADIIKIHYYDHEIYNSGLLYVHEIIDYIDICSIFGLNKEIEEIIDSIWKINKNVQKYIYLEPIIFKWNYNYGKDDWRKLVYYQKQNPSQILHINEDETSFEIFSKHIESITKRHLRKNSQ